MHEIVSTVEIAAPLSEVWRVLTEFREYARWNPVIRRISGPLMPGGVVSVLFQPSGSLPVWFRARLTVVQPELEFRWTGKLIATPLFSADHYFRLRPLAAARVQLTQGEIFSGRLARAMHWFMYNYNHSGFEQMNHALKTYVEGRIRPARVAPAEA